MTRERLSCALQMEFNNDDCHVIVRFGDRYQGVNSTFMFVIAYTRSSDTRRRVAERTKALAPNQFVKAFEWSNRELAVILSMDGKPTPLDSVIEEFISDNYWPEVTQLAV